MDPYMQPTGQHPLAQRVTTDIVREQSNHRQGIAAQLISLAGSILLALLALRFVFMLLGANPGNGIAAFVYGFTSPFVLPFSGLFSYDHISYGVSHFEGYTLVAMAVYSLIAYGVRRLATAGWWHTS